MSKSDIALRHWVFQGSYPGKEPFVFGSVSLPISAAHHEVEKELTLAWDRCFPIAPPKNAVAVPGMILFVPEEGEA